MKGVPYQAITSPDLILRDRLAIERTALANERTFLAYIRTGLAIIAVGAGLLHFFTSAIVEVCGVGFVLLGLATLVIGTARFQHTRRRLAAIGRGERAG